MIVLFLAYAVALVALSGLKSGGFFLPEILALEALLGGDKWMHFILASPLSLLAALASEAVAKVSYALRIVAVMLVLVPGLLADELHQQFFASRHFDWLDSLWGCAGLTFGCLVYLLLHWLRNYRLPEKAGHQLR
ncbi:VanZ family protein [Thalassolituus sp. LLYu03]|uniref:VanZ family protein n=1 Tax=Thalassolituus sp. LLYu03 TaxID=3421656 RepID=UPI003D280DF7